MHEALDVANKILATARATDGRSVTPMQLIKLAYLCHGWMLGLYGRPLFREDVQAWQYGPVVPSIYKAAKQYKGQPVEVDLKGASSTAEFDAKEASIIEQVYNIYGQYDGVTLSQLTHQAGSPWDVTWKEEGKSAVISNDLIERHYTALYQKSKPAAG